MEAEILKRAPVFITLNNKSLAEYVLVFRINDCYSIKELSAFGSKYQLLFQKIANRNQQVNLLFVDSGFANILADLALEVFLNKGSTIQDYIACKSRINVLEGKEDFIFLNRKFSDYIHLLLYSNVAGKGTFKDDLHTNRVYCLKNSLGELEYFSIYQQQQLHSRLLNEMKVEIDFNLSSIKNHECRLYLRMLYPGSFHG